MLEKNTVAQGNGACVDQIDIRPEPGTATIVLNGVGLRRRSGLGYGLSRQVGPSGEKYGGINSQVSIVPCHEAGEHVAKEYMVVLLLIVIVNTLRDNDAFAIP